MHFVHSVYFFSEILYTLAIPLSRDLCYYYYRVKKERGFGMRSLDKKEFRTKVCGQCACGCGSRWSEALQTKKSANRKARKNAKILCRKALTD